MRRNANLSHTVVIDDSDYLSLLSAPQPNRDAWLDDRRPRDDYAARWNGDPTALTLSDDDE